MFRIASGEHSARRTISTPSFAARVPSIKTFGARICLIWCPTDIIERGAAGTIDLCAAPAERLVVHSDIYATSLGIRLTYPTACSSEKFLP
jgi:hypothetical protein